MAAVAHAEEPLPFVAAADARPIEESSTDAPLRWKAKNLGGSQSAESLPAVPIRGAQPAVYAANGSTNTRGGWNITRIDPNVRPAQAVGDPFHDPFGDRKAGQRAPAEPMLLLQPTQAESAIEELPPPRAAAKPQPQPQPQLAEPQTPLVSQSQEPAPGPAPPAFGDPAMPGPAFGAAPPIPTTPCDQIYNERNCCDTLNGCRIFRDRLLSDTIRNISLDITPRYSPDLTPDEDMAERIDKLRQSDIITWHNRLGQTIATGRMSNLVDNEVIITDETGREVARLPLQELGENEMCYVTAFWRLPTECGLGGLRVAERNWIPSTYAWTASALCHKPLYFEQVQLERYGHTAGPIRGPIIASAHFFLHIAILPYKMGINPPHECQYALGYYRPGSCAPWMIPPIPLSLRGAAAETGAVLGGVFLLP